MIAGYKKELVPREKFSVLRAVFYYKHKYCWFESSDKVPVLANLCLTSFSRGWGPLRGQGWSSFLQAWSVPGSQIEEGRREQKGNAKIRRAWDLGKNGSGGGLGLGSLEQATPSLVSGSRFPTKGPCKVAAHCLMSRFVEPLIFPEASATRNSSHPWSAYCSMC